MERKRIRRTVNSSPTPPTSSSSRGQVGIGTLVVFVAMVLVAAIAGGVLIDTAGFLQSKSEATGEEASKQVSSRIQVGGVRGDVAEASSTEKRGIRLHGSGDIGDAKKMFFRSSATFEVNQPSGNPDTLVVDGESTVTLTDGDEITFSLVGFNTVEITKASTEKVIATSDMNATLEASNDGFMLDHQGSGTLIEVSETGAAYVKILFGRNFVTNATMTVQRASGADDIDLRDATLHYVSENVHRALTYRDGPANATRFSASSITGSDPVLAEGERVAVRVNVLAVDEGLHAGESARFRLVTAGGSTTVVRLHVPSLTGETAVAL